jgi:hypothetical protein
MDVTAAAQNGERHPLDGHPCLFWAGQLLARTAKAAIVAEWREEAG